MLWLVMFGGGLVRTQVEQGHSMTMCDCSMHNLFWCLCCLAFIVQLCISAPTCNPFALTALEGKASLHTSAHLKPKLVWVQGWVWAVTASSCVIRYKCVIILCDSQWSDPDLDSSNGIQMGLRDMLRIDSMLMMVQLNIRVLLEVCLNLLSTHLPCSAVFSGLPHALPQAFLNHCACQRSTLCFAWKACLKLLCGGLCHAVLLIFPLLAF